MKSPVIKRSIVIAGHKTSVSLEDAFWKGLKDIAVGRRTTLSDLVAAIDSERRHGNLSSAIRLFVLDHFQARMDGRGDGGHGDSGHGDSGHGDSGHGDSERAKSEHDRSTQSPRAVMAVAPAAAPSVLRPE